MKPIYKSTKPYSEDINDLVEKGGPGSGKRGHITSHPKWKAFEQAHRNLGATSHKQSLHGIDRRLKTEKMSVKEAEELYDKAKMHEHSYHSKKGND